MSQAAGRKFLISATKDGAVLAPNGGTATWDCTHYMKEAAILLVKSIECENPALYLELYTDNEPR